MRCGKLGWSKSLTGRMLIEWSELQMQSTLAYES
jgi:hypothetical protein